MDRMKPVTLTRIFTTSRHDFRSIQCQYIYIYFFLGGGNGRGTNIGLKNKNIKGAMSRISQRYILSVITSIVRLSQLILIRLRAIYHDDNARVKPTTQLRHDLNTSIVICFSVKFDGLFIALTTLIQCSPKTCPRGNLNPRNKINSIAQCMSSNTTNQSKKTPTSSPQVIT